MPPRGDRRPVKNYYYYFGPWCVLPQVATILSLSFFFLNYLFFIYLFLAALGLRYCARAFSSCGERGLLFVAVHGLLIAVASLVEHGL